jgi:sulfatase modifying factor 1
LSSPALLLASTVVVGPGTYRPLYPVDGLPTEVPVAPYALDATPVTRGAFAAFVENAPVTGVSWFAARAYCRARGGRLPTEAEWELAAAGRPDGLMDERELAEVLTWYGRPTPPALPSVGRTPANGWGAHDLHGLVWEWVEDFNASLVSVDNREQDGPDELAFCGAGALSATAREDYAAFMRVAFRSSLLATSTTRNLGFRCAHDLESR